MFRAGKWVAVVALAGASVWAGFALTAQDPKPLPVGPTDVKPDGTKPVDLSTLREAVDTAAKRGENVNEVRKALDAFEKTLPTIKAGRVPPELQALRDAVDGAAKKGENVEAITKELVAVETAVAGRSLAKPKPEPRPDLPPNPLNPPAFNPPFNPVVPFPNNPGGGIDVEAFQRGMDLRMKALELMAKNPNDPEAQKLNAEANETMLKAMRNSGRAGMPAFPDRARLGIRMEKLAAITTEQLGIGPNIGIAVTTVIPGSAAEKAGLKVHDIILEFAGKPVSDNTDDFIRLVNTAKAGEKIDLVVMRKGKKLDIKGVVLPDTARGPAFPQPRPAVPAPPLNLLPALPNAQPLPAFPNPQKVPQFVAPGVKPILPLQPIPFPKPAIDAPDTIRAAGEESKVAKPDLGDLREAVAIANKRGENVDAIRIALTAFEKALAKNTTKPGDAPPELTALRAAVENAAKKGENVEAIAKELALVEKAITGRQYERPKNVVPQPDAVRPFPPRRAPGIGGGWGGGGIVINGAGINSTSVTVSNGNFIIKAKQGDVTYAITGTADATVAPKISIKDGEKTIETDDLKKVPQDYHPTIERLLKMVNR